MVKMVIVIIVLLLLFPFLPGNSQESPDASAQDLRGGKVGE